MAISEESSIKYVLCRKSVFISKKDLYRYFWLVLKSLNKH
jgi:hypothetical protein